MTEKNILHILNGDEFEEKIQDLDISGERIIWREILCEGPTVQELGSSEFIKIRKDFLLKKYGIPEKSYQQTFLDELERLSKIEGYDEVVLWFEFDLFSHFNMLGVISFLQQSDKSFPLSLVCSAKLQGEHERLPLSELSLKHLKEHYDCRISLHNEDIETATLVWQIYCSEDPMRMVSEISKTTNFEYLSSCLRAHLERFPNTKSGLNSLEENVLKLIDNHKISSMQQLLGYVLHHQGYYGYSEEQMLWVIKKLNPFFSQTQSGIQLTQKGENAIALTENFYQELKDDTYYGGVKKYDFLYDPDSHKLLKL